MTSSAVSTSRRAPARSASALRAKALPLVLGGSLLVLLALLVGVRYPPMVDLPQHAAQLATWIHWNDPAFPNADVEINWRTPYWLAYLLARVFATVFDVVTSLTLVVWLAVIGNALAVSALARRLGHDPWVALLAVPASFGYAFYFGFVSFLVAVPLGIACLVAALDHAAAPRARSGAVLAAAACLTLIAHGVAFAIAVASALPLLLRGGGSLARRVAPLGIAVLGGALFLGARSSVSRMGADSFDGGLHRLPDLPAALVALHAGDRAGIALGLALIAAAAAGFRAPSRRLERSIPVAIVLFGFLWFPSMLNGYGFMGGRFAAFLLPALLLAFEGAAAPRARAVGRALKLGVLVVFLVVFGARSAAFQREAAAFGAIAARIPPALRVRSIVFERTGAAFPGVPLFLHLLGYYQAEKGGLLGHSFTVFHNSVLRLRPGVEPLAPRGSEWHPAAFDARVEVPAFDYFIVKSETDRSQELFGDSFVPVVLEAREGSWWVYRPVFPGVDAARRK